MNAFERNCIGSRTNLRQNCGMNEWVNNWASLIFVFYLPFGRSIRGYVGRSIGWLVGRLVNRSVSWLVGRSVGWSVCQSVCQSVGWLVGRSVPNSFLVWLSVEGWILAMNLFSLSLELTRDFQKRESNPFCSSDQIFSCREIMKQQQWKQHNNSNNNNTTNNKNNNNIQMIRL